MKILITASRALLGLSLKLFGLNGFLHVIPSVGGFAGAFIDPIFASHYLPVVYALASIGGTFLLINWQTPLAVTLLSPVVTNIVSRHAFSAPAGSPLALLIALLWCVIAFSVRSGVRELLTKAWKRISTFDRRKSAQLVSRERNALQRVH